MCETNYLREERAIWYWQEQGNLADTNVWNAYEDIDNEIIESAYLQNKKQVNIDGYLIDLERFIQQDIKTGSDQTIKSEMIVKRSLTREQPHRSSDYFRERFVDSQIPVKAFGETLIRNYSPYLKEWAEKHERQEIHRIGTPLFKIFKYCYSIQYNVYLACDGIIQEGKKLGRECEATWIADQLMDVDRKENSADYIPKENKQWTTVTFFNENGDNYSKAIGARCAWLYSRDSFLFRLLNKTLRDGDTSKLTTLGPFIYLLECFDSPSLKTSNLTLYRGELLNENMKECYRQAVGTLKSWLAFTSTSKNRQLAEVFGDTLFIITFDKNEGFSITRDISGVSQFPMEEEVLLRSGVIFMVEKIEIDHTNAKCIIYLNVRE